MIAAVVLLAHVVSITIDSTWGGLGRSGAYHDTIERARRGFVRSDRSPVPDAAVQTLISALKLPHAEAQAARLHVIAKDDGPQIFVAIAFDDGEEIDLRSTSQRRYMLPFAFLSDRMGDGYINDPRVSFAIAGLMANGATNKARLASSDP